MCDVPQFDSPEKIMSWLEKQKSKTSEEPINNDARESKKRNVRSMRKKIRDEELLDIVLEIQNRLNQFGTIELNDIFHPVELDEHHRRLGPNSLEAQICEASTKARGESLRFALDIIDTCINKNSLPKVKRHVIFWLGKAISAYVSQKCNTKREAASWQSFPRNLIAGTVLMAVDDAWFTGGPYLRDFASKEALNIFNESSSLYSNYPRSPWGWN